VRVGSIEPGGQPSAQSNGGHIEGNFNAQNPAYRWASHFFCMVLLKAMKKRAVVCKGAFGKWRARLLGLEVSESGD